MKRKSVLVVLVMGLCFTPPASAANIFETIGALKKLVSFIGGLIGETEVTPAACLKSYYDIDYGMYFGVSWHVQKTVNRDLLGSYYYTEKHTYDDGTTTVSHEPFPILSVARASGRCVYNPTTFYARSRTFSMCMWAHSVTHTGFFPPSEPYPAWLKSQATQVSYSCDPPGAVVFNAITGDGIMDSGETVVTFPHIPYEYALPALCWVGEMTDM